MKINLICLFLICISAVTWAEGVESVLLCYENSTHYIYEERVNVRSAPDLKSEKVGLALIGEPVKILKKMNKTEELYGLKAHWYKVEWKGKTCYIWGGLISNIDIKGDFDRDGREEILMSLATGSDWYPDEYMVQYSHNLRFCRVGQFITNTPFQGEILKDSRFNVIKNRGFTPDVPLLEIHWAFGDGPGGVRNSQLFYWVNGRFELLTGRSSSQFFNDSNDENCIYPNDKRGKRNTLIVEKRVTEYESEESDVLVKDNVLEWTKEFLWDGKLFKEVK